MAQDKKNEQLSQWRERKERINCGFSYAAKTVDKNTVCLDSKFSNENLTARQKAELQMEALCSATGAASVKYGELLFSQTFLAFFRHNSDFTASANAVHEALLAMNPQDEYEGMLCSRLLVLHDQYMQFMARTTMPEQNAQSIDNNINRATKLMRLYNETLDTLNRYRRKGEQKVTVQHVNVNNGGQAVVAGQFTQGGDNTKK